MKPNTRAAAQKAPEPRVRGMQRLHDDLPGAFGAPRTSRDLQQQLPRALGSAEVCAEQRAVAGKNYLRPAARHRRKARG